MATKKDLVEAYQFSRRRLVTAFVSGAPGGREVEPARPGRTIVGGVALSVLLIAGALIGGIFKSQKDIDWSEPAFIVAKDRGSLFVIVDRKPDDEQPALRSIINVTSAQLIMGADVEAVTVDLDEINKQDKGPTIGILGAPPTVPEASDLVETGWTACTNSDTGVKVTVQDKQSLVTEAPELGFVVESTAEGGTVERYLIAQDRFGDAYSYKMPKKESGAEGQLNSQLGELAPPNEATKVPQSWLLLFPQGGPLDADGLDIGTPGAKPTFAGAELLPKNAKIGDYFMDGETPVVVTNKGPASFDEFAFTVIRNTKFKKFKPKQLTGSIGADRTDDPAYRESANWPESLLSRSEDGEMCALLDASTEEAPAVRLAQRPTGNAVAESIEAAQVETEVESGYGAFVLAGGWDAQRELAEEKLIDDRGLVYPLVGPEVPGKLGYDEDDAPVVPDTWVDLFEVGVVLSIDKALCPPAADDAEPGSPWPEATCES